MPLTNAGQYPPSEALLKTSHDDPKATYLIFYSDVEGGKMWCPHCRDVEGLLRSNFEGKSKPHGVITYIGPYSGWKNVPTHPARIKYGVRTVPAIIKFDSTGKELDRVDKSGILDSARFEEFLES
ncbi:uncharacterized protein I303_108552 [Kwoniella dejecticola CBS 10117]|uniref:Thioredoxin domain-containing protein n=1 Tax=Kwoniella dejecticola CBS 10117 TaxID=1296121 RepID=A0A1A5ZX30_9TREE|nr:uncharacterized protein I303_07123 [Kwoniella dejecticola CBS 10117]OBR82364.1 hypothetical protein I303_07123 [Kwoniella dejecticola CBS 10117]